MELVQSTPFAFPRVGSGNVTSSVPTYPWPCRVSNVSDSRCFFSPRLSAFPLRRSSFGPHSERKR